MDKIDKYFLSIVNKNESIEYLYKIGLDYSQIALIVNKHIKNGNIAIDEHGISLTENGIRALLDPSVLSTNLNKFTINPEYKSITPKISLEEVYIPHLNTLKKLLKQRRSL